MKTHNKLLVVSLMLVLAFSLAGCSGDDGGSSSIATYTITTEVTQGEGEIKLSPDQDDYKKGTEVTVEAVSNGGYNFSKWSGNLSGTEKKQTITVDSNMTIAAEYEKIPNTDPEFFTFDTGTIKEYNTVGGFDVVIPSKINDVTVTSIGGSAFESNDLTSVQIPDSVTSIGDSAFHDNKITSVQIPDSVTSIGDYAFYDNKLTSVQIPDSVTSIGGSVFFNNKITSVQIPDSVTSIGERAFVSNELTSVQIPDSVTSIGRYAFGNNDLTSVQIPDSVTSIGDSAFYNNKLTSVEIGNDVTIDSSSFGNNFKDVYEYNNKEAGTYVRADTNSSWEKK